MRQLHKHFVTQFTLQKSLDAKSPLDLGQEPHQLLDVLSAQAEPLAQDLEDLNVLLHHHKEEVLHLMYTFTANCVEVPLVDKVAVLKHVLDDLDLSCHASKLKYVQDRSLYC